MDGRLSSLNLIDVVSRKAHIRQYAGQTMDNMIGFLPGYRPKNVIPKYLQMDNSASFIGDLIHSGHFTAVSVWLCLHPGVEPVFIAPGPGKPWMNDTPEDFNGDFGEKLWEREQWRDPEHIRAEAKIFLMRHNNRQDRKYRKTDPDAIIQHTTTHHNLPEDFGFGANSLPVTEGKVHFIREVRGDETISVLNENFDVSESLVYEYVRATIDTKQEQLVIYYREKKAGRKGMSDQDL